MGGRIFEDRVGDCNLRDHTIGSETATPPRRAPRDGRVELDSMQRVELFDASIDGIDKLPPGEMDDEYSRPIQS